jgi:hypothetical protein
MSQHNLGSVLKRLETDQRTGSLVCVGEDSVFGRVYLVDGKPRVARCSHLQGKEALLQLNGAQLVSIKFYKDINLIKSSSDDAGIEGFDAGDVEAEAVDLSSSEIESVTDLEVVTQGIDQEPFAGKKLSDQVREVLVEELVEFVGPVSQMMVSGLEDDISLVDALKLLAGEIGDKDMARLFVEKVKQKIQVN